MSDWLTLATERFLRRMLSLFLATAVALAAIAVALWLVNAREVSVVLGAGAWAVAVAAAFSSYNAKQRVPSQLALEESSIRIRYLNGRSSGIPRTEIELVRRVASGPLILSLREGGPITIRTSKKDATKVLAEIQAHQIRVL